MTRIEHVDYIIKSIMEYLPCVSAPNAKDEPYDFFVDIDETEILSRDESKINLLANLFDFMYGEGTVKTGYYNPEEDERNGEVDEFTGLYYLSID